MASGQLIMTFAKVDAFRRILVGLLAAQLFFGLAGDTVNLMALAAAEDTDLNETEIVLLPAASARRSSRANGAAAPLSWLVMSTLREPVHAAAAPAAAPRGFPEGKHASRDGAPSRLRC